MYEHSIVMLLCAIGFYISTFMWRKSRRAKLGLIIENSVVKEGPARLIAGIPNSLFGMFFYPYIAVSTLFAHAHLLLYAAATMSLLAAAMSIYLGYTLLIKLRMPCPFCWTAHAVNILLLIVTAVEAASTLRA